MSSISRRFLHTSRILSKAQKMDYPSYFSKLATLTQPSPIRELMPLVKLPGMISLGGGMPNPSTFPFSSMTLKLQNGDTLMVSEASLKEGLQYSNTKGIPELLQHLKEIQLREHYPPYDPIEICCGNGSQDVLAKALELFLNPGDTIIVEKPTYVGTLVLLRSLNSKVLEVEVDKEGPVPESLDDLLSNWKEKETKPKVFYTIPTASNPSGVSTSLARKKRIYDLAKKHNLLILEDDPYFYLQYGNHRIPSYLSMDVDGRVLRFDSFSKVLSSGLRLGWASGPPVLIDKIAMRQQATNLHCSGVSQIMVKELLKKWGVHGFLNHAQTTAKFYEQQCDAFISSAEKHLQGLAEWNEPSGGMFVWLKLLGVKDSKSLIMEKAVEKKVLMVPGCEFVADRGPTPYVRCSFSTATKEEIDLALSRLAQLIKENQTKE